jgi:hypothetical protein
MRKLALLAFLLAAGAAQADPLDRLEGWCAEQGGSWHRAGDAATCTTQAAVTSIRAVDEAVRIRVTLAAPETLADFQAGCAHLGGSYALETEGASCQTVMGGRPILLTASPHGDQLKVTADTLVIPPHR